MTPPDASTHALQLPRRQLAMAKLEARRRRISTIRRRVAAIAVTLFIATSAWIMIQLAVSQAKGTPTVARTTSSASTGSASSGSSRQTSSRQTSSRQTSSRQTSSRQTSSSASTSVSPVQTSAS